MQLATVLLLAALGSIPRGEHGDAKTRVGGIDLADAARICLEGSEAAEGTGENFAATTDSRRAVYSLGFTGHQYDPESGLVYARARYYDPDLGLFLSRDSLEGEIGDAPSLHRYMYVRSNPLRYTDPTGHQFQTSCETPTGAPACIAILESGAEGATAAGTATATAAPAAGAATSTGASAAGATTATGVSAAGATSTTAQVATATATTPWWKVAAASLVAAILGDKPKDMTHEERRQAAEEEARRISQTTRDLTGQGVKVVAEGPNGGQVIVPVREPGSTPLPQKAPGRDTGKVITEPEKSPSMSAPGMGGAPQVAPGADEDRSPVYASDGVSRAERYSKNWPEASLSETVGRIAGDKPVVSTTDSGKVLYTNPQTGIRVVYDPQGNYFRVEDPSAERGVDRYLDQNGQRLPQNVPLVRQGRTTQTGVPKDVRKALTHFKNSDPKPEGSP